MTKSKKRIVVAMSGGVDSSAACGLLAREGHEVIGITLRLWTPSPWNDGERFGSCCSPLDTQGAKQVCRSLGVPHYTFNLEEKFKEKVVDRFVSEYLEGKTPNPCVQCNLHIKFDVLFKYAMALNADFLATGHYARILRDGETFRLAKAQDPGKDQSYFLYMLDQSRLSRLLFPVGEYTKPEVRRLAEEMDLATAKKPESQDVCFLEGGSYQDFVKRAANGGIKRGPILTRDGRKLGEHAGLPYYTIGQREKLGVAAGRRLYVLEKQNDTNTLVVGTEEENAAGECRLTELFWTDRAPGAPLRAQVKIRYRHPGAWASVEPLSPGEARVRFETPQSSLTSGQSAVFYDGDFVLGGGVIV